MFSKNDKYRFNRTRVNFLQEFRLLHFAGDVTYNIKGFLDKNNDLLFRDLKEVSMNTRAVQI